MTLSEGRGLFFTLAGLCTHTSTFDHRWNANTNAKNRKYIYAFFRDNTPYLYCVHQYCERRLQRKWRPMTIVPRTILLAYSYVALHTSRLIEGVSEISQTNYLFKYNWNVLKNTHNTQLFCYVINLAWFGRGLVRNRLQIVRLTGMVNFLLFINPYHHRLRHTNR